MPTYEFLGLPGADKVRFKSHQLKTLTMLTHINSWWAESKAIHALLASTMTSWWNIPGYTMLYYCMQFMHNFVHRRKGKDVVKATRIVKSSNAGSLRGLGKCCLGSNEVTRKALLLKAFACLFKSSNTMLVYVTSKKKYRVHCMTRHDGSWLKQIVFVSFRLTLVCFLVVVLFSFCSMAFRNRDFKWVGHEGSDMSRRVPVAFADAGVAMAVSFGALGRSEGDRYEMIWVEQHGVDEKSGESERERKAERSREREREKMVRAGVIQ